MVNKLIFSLLQDCKNLVLEMLFPKKCVACNTEGSFLCQACNLSLIEDKFPVCIVCNKPSLLGFTHPKCQTPFAPDGLITFLNYHDPKVAKILISGKYYFLPEIYELLGRKISPLLTRTHLYALNDAILCPIPLHKQRKRWRGFNQAEILASALSKELGIHAANLLERNKYTKTQKDLAKEARIKNIQGVFELKKGANVKNQTIILVDDVVTTGTTMKEAAKVLNRNGAGKVFCLAVARD